MGGGPGLPSLRGTPYPRRLRSGKLVPSCHLLPALPGWGGVCEGRTLCPRALRAAVPGAEMGVVRGKGAPWGGERGMARGGRVVADGSCGVAFSSAHLPSSPFASTSLHLAHHHPPLSHSPSFLISLKLPGRQAEGRERGRGDFPGWGRRQCGPLAPVPGARQGLRWACPRSATRHLDGPEALPLSASSSPNFRAPRAPQVSTSLCPSYPASQVPLLGPRAVLPSPRLLFAGRAPDPVS